MILDVWSVVSGVGSVVSGVGSVASGVGSVASARRWSYMWRSLTLRKGISASRAKR